MQLTHTLHALKQSTFTLTLANVDSHEHERGYHLSATLVIDGEPALNFTQPGDGSAAQVEYLSERMHCATDIMLDAMNFGGAMRRDGWSLKTPHQRLQLECLIGLLQAQTEQLITLH